MNDKGEDLTRSYAAMLEVPPWPPDGGEASAGPEGTSTPPPPLRIVEALLFVGGTPLTAGRVTEIIRGFSAEQFVETVDALNRAYRRQHRPYTIVARGDGYVLALRPKHRGVMEKLYGSQREARLSTAA